MDLNKTELKEGPGATKCNRQMRQTLLAGSCQKLRQCTPDSHAGLFEYIEVKHQASVLGAFASVHTM